MSKKTWESDELSAHFKDLLEETWVKGPQTVSSDGTDLAVVVHIDHWKLMQERTNPTLKEVLLGPGPRGDTPIPSRKDYRPRPIPDFSDD